MTHRTLNIGVLLLACLVAGAGIAAPAMADSPPALSCTLGPVSRSFGRTDWLIYACDDGRSLVVVSAPGSRAAPFYFFLAFGAGGMELHGEGTGNKQATDAAFASLKLLTEADAGKLYAEAKAVGSPAKP